MLLAQNRLSPMRLFMLAGSLLLAFSGQVTSSDCKPKIDKGNIVVELSIPNFNGGKRVVTTMPVKAKEAPGSVTGSIIPASFNKAAGSLPYELYISQKRKDGAMLELTLNMQAKNGSPQSLRKTIFVPHDRIIEQQYLNGVQVKTYFKLKPFSCKSI